ncbi:MAG: hypothetical protein IPK68_11255 [Bdellovibrionales bacterium]|nr:hypothetical protein [Bdellovibrionales bacterium]
MLKKQAQTTKGTTDLEIIRSNADELISKVAEEIKNDLSSSNSTVINREDLEFSSIAMTCHAFINCKILEKPTK